MTLIQKKFNYEEIKRPSVSGKECTCVPTGTQFGCNPILDSTKDKTYLMEWRKKVGEETARMITQEAHGIGTHAQIFRRLNSLNTGQWKDPILGISLTSTQDGESSPDPSIGACE